MIRTKRVPLVGRDVEGFARDYRRYFDRHAAGMQIDEVSHDGQTQPQTALRSGSGTVSLPEAIKNVGQKLRFDPDA